MRKYIREGELRPKWYFRAYRDFNKDMLVCYPIGINLLAALYHWAQYKWFTFLWNVVYKMQVEERSIYRLGFERGYERGARDRSSWWRRTLGQEIFNRYNETKNAPQT